MCSSSTNNKRSKLEKKKRKRKKRKSDSYSYTLLYILFYCIHLIFRFCFPIDDEQKQIVSSYNWSSWLDLIIIFHTTTTTTTTLRSSCLRRLHGRVAWCNRYLLRRRGVLRGASQASRRCRGRSTTRVVPERTVLRFFQTVYVTCRTLCRHMLPTPSTAITSARPRLPAPVTSAVLPPLPLPIPVCVLILLNIWSSERLKINGNYYKKWLKTS